MFSLFNSFKKVALFEGISYLVLFGNMLFIKPFFSEVYQVLLFPIGMTHGLLFMAYIILAIFLGAQLKWNTKTLLIVLAASIIPFGTFYVDRNYLKKS